ncbi:MAG: hypothetical protein LBD16_07370 [Oscillospiraceae bacterium]|jgi:hypothetical protein|nr:hypothetical protein [Oscillospiraceae bacterium]
MPDQAFDRIQALQPPAAINLADVVKTKPQFAPITPRWITRFLEFKGIDNGIYRINRVVETGTPLDVLCSKDSPMTNEIPQGFVDYAETPRELLMKGISTIINVDTRVQDLYSKPFNQTEEQIALAVESLKERQESQLVNDPDYGLLICAAPHMRTKTLAGPPTPDDLDELLSLVWKEPTFFLAHPRALAAFERECTKRGVPPVTKEINGGNFIVWRGVPIVPTDKLFVDGEKYPKGKGGKTSIMLVRTGENKRGAIGLYQKGVPNDMARGMSLRFRGINDHGVSSYLLTVYCAAAVLADDAVAVLEDVDVGQY